MKEAAVKSKWSRKAKTISGVAIIAVGCVIALIVYFQMQKYSAVKEYENEVLNSIDALSDSLRKAKSTGDVAPLIPIAERANKTMFQMQFASYYVMDGMPEPDFIEWRLKFKKKFDKKRDEALTLLKEVQALAISESLDRAALSYVDEMILSFSVKTAPVPPGGRRIDHIFAPASLKGSSEK